MQSGLVAEGKLELIRPSRRNGTALTELRFSIPERSTRDREQVAAVCYRRRKSKVEFLLVQTRKGRWTFPKGGIMRGLTRAQSAALEAFEEGGVRGRIEEAPFARYTLGKRTADSEILTHAFLCEVLRMGTPQEPNRNPTWFAPEKAKLRLKEQRAAENGAELVRVLVRAVMRIERLANEPKSAEPLRRVLIESSQANGNGLVARFAVLRALGRKPGEASHRVLEFDGQLDNAGRRIVRLGTRRLFTLGPR
jgi:8-oxo-dGTP pyrophosphatase MutT (NUDIX family)